MVGVVGMRTGALSIVVRLENGESGGYTNGSRPLSFSKPSLVVRTQSNVRKMVRKKPDPPCVVCQGTGKVHCYDCSGKGRTNYVHLAMLPKGEWPKWCRTCGGSGLGYCFRCLGTGEYRHIMGFHFMNKDSDSYSHSNDGKKLHLQQQIGTAADRFLQADQQL